MRRTGILSFALSLLLLPFGLPGAYGQAVLERRVMSTASPVRTADTYHVYDALGLLVAEVPPELAASLSTGAVSQTSVNKYAFLYLYDDLGGTLERTLDYGPYGESLGTDWAATSAPAARKLFIGKEKLKSDDTELYDFGARRNDPTLPRWTSVDPLAGKYPGLSLYSYCLADPVNALDPNGTHIYTFSSNGTWTKEPTEDDYNILVSVSGEQLLGVATLSVFKFLADNTTVEWLLYNGENGEALLGTNHQSGVVSEETLYTYVCTRSSIMESDPVWKIHNHPGETNNERESMLTDIDNTKEHTSLQSFVYISQSGNLYLIQNERVKKNVQWGDILRLYQVR